VFVEGGACATAQWQSKPVDKFVVVVCRRKNMASRCVCMCVCVCVCVCVCGYVVGQARRCRRWTSQLVDDDDDARSSRGSARRASTPPSGGGQLRQTSRRVPLLPRRTRRHGRRLLHTRRVPVPGARSRPRKTSQGPSA